LFSFLGVCARELTAEFEYDNAPTITELAEGNVLVGSVLRSGLRNVNCI